jgi:hypothetical protein
MPCDLVTIGDSELCSTQSMQKICDRVDRVVKASRAPSITSAYFLSLVRSLEHKQPRQYPLSLAKADPYHSTLRMAHTEIDGQHSDEGVNEREKT